ncbi:hypothetical protein GCM10027408_29120 [Microbacterium tumbae]
MAAAVLAAVVLAALLAAVDFAAAVLPAAVRAAADFTAAVRAAEEAVVLLAAEVFDAASVRALTAAFLAAAVDAAGRTVRGAFACADGSAGPVGHAAAASSTWSAGSSGEGVTV